jgi:RNA polymerase sigma-70 factor (ECF subfamily)
VWRVARQVAGQGREPEDLVQETYMRAYAVFGSYRGGNARAWLAAICLNAARSQARRRRRRPFEVPGPAAPDVLPWSRPDGGEGTADVAEVVLADLEIEEVSRCLALLPGP